MKQSFFPLFLTFALHAWTGCASAPEHERPASPVRIQTPGLNRDALYEQCGFSPTPSNKAFHGQLDGAIDRAPNALESRALGPLLKTAEQVRDLKFKTPVPIRIQDDDFIRAYLESEIDAEELNEAYITFGVLGLLDADADLGTLLLDVLGEQVIGYYNPKEEYLAVRNDVVSGLAQKDTQTFGEAHAVLVHELVHALQGQHLNLHKLHGQKRKTDADAAFQALVEGDATLAMIADFASALGIPLSKLTSNLNMLDQVMPTDGFGALPAEKLRNAPPILQAMLLSPYLDGLRFVAHLHSQGGWKAVNEAYASPPTTMSEVLHPEAADFTRKLRSKLPTMSLPKQLPLGYTLIIEDSLGELVWRSYLAQNNPRQTAIQAAEGWLQDKLGIYRNPKGRYAAVWFSDWLSETDAKEAHEAAQSAHGLSRPKSCRACFFTSLKGRRLLITRALPPPARQVL
ncbi:MAG: hypothetical protein IPJ88_10710 [Myxococcales bacterium]|nr:MAG: hypothetical protein IPJ88_10710 [Myxococcales bacterium]